MDYFKKIFKESVIVVIVSSIIGIFSGTFLSEHDELLYSFPIILLLLPSLNSLIGDMCTILTSRLTSHLYIGTIPPKIKKSNKLIQDFYGLFFTILLSIVALIIIGYSVGIISGIEIVNPFLIIFLIFITIVSLFVVMFVFLFITSILLFKLGKDPNNYLIPIITSLLDFLTPVLLILFLQIFI
ncbi:MAG: magnesium transporter [Candidatus Lokiarchaeota archaeon]|jgi:mgtE-like transporter